MGTIYHAGSYTVERAEIIEFATKWDALPMHVDPVAAEAGYFKGLIASGIHTFAIWQRLSVLNVLPGWQIIAGRDLELRYPAPVHAGATLTGTMEVLWVEAAGRMRGIVSKQCRLVDEDSTLVFDLQARVFMRRRPTT